MKDKSYHKISYVQKEDPVHKRILMHLVEVLSGRRKIQKLYQEVQDMDFNPLDVWSICLDKLGIKVECDYGNLGILEKNRASIIIANHPFGVVDGLIICDLASKVNEKFSIIVNSALTGHDYRLNDFLLPIDFENTKQAIQTNINTKRAAIERVERDETIVIFPSGGVATSKKWFLDAEDLEWKRFVAKLIKKSKCPVLPVYFHGKNSRAFQIASSINQNLRLGLLMNEIRNKIGKTIKVEIGEPIQYNQYREISSNQQLIDFLRDKVMQLDFSNKSIRKEKKI